MRLAGRLEHDAEPLERRLAHVVRLEPGGRDPQSGFRQRRLEVDDRHRRRARPAHECRVPARAQVRIEPDAHVQAKAAVRGDGVEVPALVPQLLAAGLVRLPRRPARGRSGAGLPAPAGGSRSLGLQVDRVLRVARDHGHEHLVAPLRALHHHRGEDRHQHAAEGVAAVLLPGVLEREAVHAVAAQRLVIFAKELLLVRAPIRDREAAAEEVGGIRRRSAPAHRLPVDDRERLRAALLAEEQVVQPKVAVHEAEAAAAGRRATRRGWRRSARTAPGARPRCDLRSARGNPGSSCGHERLADRRRLVEPGGRRRAPGRPSTGACTRASSLMTSRAWSTRAPTDLVALQRRRHVFEQQGEPAVRAVLARSGRREAGRRSAVRAPGRSGSRAHRCPCRHRWRGSSDPPPPPSSRRCPGRRRSTSS